MKYCSNCGSNLSEHPGAIYCFQCGVKLDSDSDQHSKSTNAETGETAYPVNKEFDSYGIIYTDLDALSKKFKKSKTLIKSLIDIYADMLKATSHQYFFLDASNNDISLLTPSDPWQKHVKLLNDYQ